MTIYEQYMQLANDPGAPKQELEELLFTMMEISDSGGREKKVDLTEQEADDLKLVTYKNHPDVLAKIWLYLLPLGLEAMGSLEALAEQCNLPSDATAQEIAEAAMHENMKYLLEENCSENGD